MNTPAYIFDFDGVLVDTMEAHYLSMRDACAEAGIRVSRDMFFGLAGMPAVDQIARFARETCSNIDPMEVFDRKQELYLKEHINDVRVIESNHALITTLHSAGVKVAIATSGARAVVMPLIKRLKIPYNALVSFEDVKAGKPDPEVFLTAARMLGVPSENCVVIEDSEAGMEAARRAGMAALRFCLPQEAAVGSHRP